MKAIVIHSGGMDSSICLLLAAKEHGKDHVLSLSFDYGQVHKNELIAAKTIAAHFGIAHEEIPLDVLSYVTSSTLMGMDGTSLVPGRNGLLARLGGLRGRSLGAREVWTGVIERENSGYPDCSRAYMDLMERVLRLDFQDPEFLIRTPLVGMTKGETLVVAEELGVLEVLLKETVTCYLGVKGEGCGECAACVLRARGLADFRRGLLTREGFDG